MSASVPLICNLLIVITTTRGYQDTFAIVYNNENNNYFNEVTAENYGAVFIYTGGIETYCRGIQGSQLTDPCVFLGPSPNSFVYYTAENKAAVSAYSQAGYMVYLHWDASPDYLANFEDLSDTELADFANTTANIVCNEQNIDGFAIEISYNLDQNAFYTKLAPLIEACDKRWGVFANSHAFNTPMWNLFGSHGFVMEYAYVLDENWGVQECECWTPATYYDALAQNIRDLAVDMAGDVAYKIVFEAVGSHHMFTNYTGSAIGCDLSCPYPMEEWMQIAMDVLDDLNVKNDPNFDGIAIKDYSEGDNDGYLPLVPPSTSLDVIKHNGYWLGLTTSNPTESPSLPTTTSPSSIQPSLQPTEPPLMRPSTSDPTDVPSLQPIGLSTSKSFIVNEEPTTAPIMSSESDGSVISTPTISPSNIESGRNTANLGTGADIILYVIIISVIVLILILVGCIILLKMRKRVKVDDGAKDMTAREEACATSGIESCTNSPFTTMMPISSVSSIDSNGEEEVGKDQGTIGYVTTNGNTMGDIVTNPMHLDKENSESLYEHGDIHYVEDDYVETMGKETKGMGENQNMEVEGNTITGALPLTRK